MYGVLRLTTTSTANFKTSLKFQIPAGTVHRARLVLPAATRDPNTLFKPQTVKCGGVALPWAGPRGNSINCTDQCTGGAEVEFDCSQFTGWAGVPHLLVLLDAPGVATPGPAVAAVQTTHFSGQVFITWPEITDPAIPVLGPNPTPSQYKAAWAAIKANKNRIVNYHVYEASAPDYRMAVLVDEVRPLSCWWPERWGFNCYNASSLVTRTTKETEIIPRYRVPVGNGTQTLDPGTGLYVHTPRFSGTRYYGVVPVINGTEDLTRIVWSEAVTVNADLVPDLVLQFSQTQTTANVANCQTDYFVRWESPETLTSNFPNTPCGVAIHRPPNQPSTVGAPCVVSPHEWSGYLGNLTHEWQLLSRGSMLITLAERPEIYSFHMGHNDAMGTLKSFAGGVWHSYAFNRHVATVDRLMTIYQMDRQQLTVFGASMGGTGSLALALWAKGAFSACHTRVGALIPKQYCVPQTASHPSPGNWLRNCWGPPIPEQQAIPCFIRGEFAGNDPYEVCDLVATAAKNPDHCWIIEGTGLDTDPGIPGEQHRQFIESQNAIGGLFAAEWGTAGHLTRARWPSAAHLDTNETTLLPKLGDSLPAFVACSINDDPRLTTVGQRNLWLSWANVLDTAIEWSCDVTLNQNCPHAACDVTVIPRRCTNWNGSQTSRVTLNRGVAQRVKFTKDPDPDPIPVLTPQFVASKLTISRNALDECDGQMPAEMIAPLSNATVALNEAAEACAAWERGELS